ncbi:MAG: GMC family oxidoreductase [Pirellula sp.]|jgi:choline dehydrogenase-like flavoprotein|nr:GMC family oxidoreductase [Pirellula sp.]
MTRKDICLSQDIASRYDYIIVGSGSAGSVLASELANLQAGRILLIEEGIKAGHHQSRRPVLYPHLFQNLEFSHRNRTTPQANLSGRSLLLPSGKGLGGSTLINAMILSPPHPSDLERWHRLLGPKWDTQSMSGLLGELYDRLDSHVDRDPELHPISLEILRCMAADTSSASVFPYNRLVRNGRRESIWRVLRRSCSSEMITLIRGCKVESVVISGDRAVGVNLHESTDSTPETILANKAVLLSAGALKTPTILMRSGIGPKESILMHRSLTIDSPQVGKNLSDHLVFPLTFASSSSSLPSQMDDIGNRLWIDHGSGPMASNIAELGAFGWHDGEHNYTLSNSEDTLRPCFQWHITPSHYLEYPTKIPATNAVSVGVTILHPKSRGCVDWQKDGSFSIDPNYLSNASDEVEMKTVVKWTRQWLRRCPWQSILTDELIPGSRRQSDESVLAMIKRLSSTIYHYVGTSAVGTAPNSVCDPDFRVRGCEGLYVCDGSSLPDQVSGNPQVTIMLFALKLAREIAEKQQPKNSR